MILAVSFQATEAALKNQSKHKETISTLLRRFLI